MTTRTKIFACCAILIALLPTLFFPLGTDHFTFLRGGEVVMNGGKIYADYYDQKPPMIYYIFGIGGEIFGYTEIGMRIYDLIFQISIVLSLLYVIRKRTSNVPLAYMIALIYAVSYTALNASVTLQCESFAGLALVWLLYFQTALYSADMSGVAKVGHGNILKGSSPALTLVLRGVCVGVAAGLKYPMGLALIAVMLDDLLMMGFAPRKLLRYWSLTMLGVIGMLVLMLIPLFDSHVWLGYQRMWEYAVFYTSMPAVNSAFIRFLLKGLSRFLGDNYSFFSLVCIGASLAVFFRRDRESVVQRYHWIGFSFLLAVFLMGSIVIEKKLITYHFLRLYVPLSVLSGSGAMILFSAIRTHWKDFVLYQRGIAAMIACTLLVFSPFPRWMNLAIVPYYYYYAPGVYDAFFVTEGETVSMRADMKRVARLIEADSSARGGRTFAIATYASAIYYHLNERPFSKLTYSVWYFSTVEITGMRREFIEELHGADWLVIEKDDHHPFLFGHSRSSKESLERDTEAYSYVTEHFRLVQETEFFTVMKRLKTQ
ncbi:MAG: glycosyltransferase family 39 protein [Candidatus Kapaibacterium sp.]